MDEKGLVVRIREYMARLVSEGRFSTAKSYQDAMNSFVRYSGTRKISFSQINKENLRRYETFLVGCGCSRNTISTYMRRLRCVYNMAVEKGEAEYIPNLFRDVFTGVESKRKKSLSLEDQHKLMTVRVQEKRLRQTQLAVCLMYQYGGMAFVDFVHLKPENIKKGILDYTRQKTGTPMRLEVLAVAEEMRSQLEKTCESEGTYIFPFLTGRKKGHAEYKEYNAALGRFNRDLRDLGRVAGLSSEITSYTIRHSFAMALKEGGASIEVISELLGHKSIKTTQIYLRSFSLERLTAANGACFESVYNYVSNAG